MGIWNRIHKCTRLLVVWGRGVRDRHRERQRERKRLNIPLVPWPAPKIRFYLCKRGFYLRRDFVMKT